MNAASAPLGVVMLCHTALNRAAQVARFWLDAGCPVVMHVDRAVTEPELQRLKADIGPHALLRYSTRHRCDWGSWQIVAATQDACEVMLEEFADVNHVLLTSGACLPLRPASDMVGYLQERPKVDFIESVLVTHATWIMGGLSVERFTLYFPFNWRRQRGMFDWFVGVQRKWNIRRKIPDHLRPHMGSQWWCLSRETLSAILTDPRRKQIERFFRHNWIPDESYFQTLARQHSEKIDSRSLTLVKFDRHGRPNLFYDDHLHLLRRSDCFMARKIWPDADRLYDFFLSDRLLKTPALPAEPAKIDRYFELAAKQRVEGRAGLYMQSRFPSEDCSAAKTAGPYSVFSGFDHIFEDFNYWLGQVLGTRVHGHLFAPDIVQFHGGAKVWHGAISNSAAIRDYNPRMFLTNLLWATRGERQCFTYGPEDTMDHEVNWFMATDINAEFNLVRGAWMLPLWRQGQVSEDVIAQIGQLQKREQDWIKILQSRWTLAKVRIWSIADVVKNPDETLLRAVSDIADEASLQAHGFAKTKPLDGFDQYLVQLRDHGLPTQLLKDFQV